MDKLTVELQDGYFVEIDSLNHTLRQRYAGQDKDGNEKESVRTIGYFGDMKQCIKALLERYPRELSEKAQISFDEYLELLDKAYTRSEQLVNSLGKPHIEKPQTNADRIRSMTDEELLDFLCSIETYEQGSVKTIEGGVAMCSVTEVEQWLKAESEG